jgi:hypothetical protein
VDTAPPETPSRHERGGNFGTLQRGEAMRSTSIAWLGSAGSVLSAAARSRACAVTISPYAQRPEAAGCSAGDSCEERFVCSGDPREGSCVGCGGDRGLCCAGNTCWRGTCVLNMDGRFICRTDCGGSGQACCEPGTRDVCGEELSCTGTPSTCTACDGPGEACCPGDLCDSPQLACCDLTGSPTCNPSEVCP